MLWIAAAEPFEPVITSEQVATPTVPEQITKQIGVAEGHLAEVVEARKQLESELANLRERFRRVQEQTQTLPVDGPFAEILANERGRLARLASQKGARIDEARQMVNTMRVDAIQTARSLDERVSPNQSAARDRKTVALLEKLDAAYAKLGVELSGLVSVRTEFTQLASEYAGFLDGKLFWVRTAYLADGSALRSIGDGLRWFAGVGRVRVAADAIASGADSNKVATLFLLLVLALYLIGRKRVVSWLTETGVRIRKIANDHFLATAEAFFFTGLLALPLPLTSFTLGVFMTYTSTGNSWTAYVGEGLKDIEGVLLGLIFLYGTLRPGGLGPAHFGWNKTLCDKLRKILPFFIFCIAVCLLVMATCRHDFVPGDGRDHLGRLATILLLLSFSLMGWIIFSPRYGLLKFYYEKEPGRGVSRLRALWVVLAVGIPLMVAGMGAAGFHYASSELLERIRPTGTLIILVMLGHGLLHRWFTMRQRHIALHRALEKRRAAALEKGEKDREGEIPVIEDEEDIDVLEDAQQIGELLRFLVFVALLTGLWSIWAGLLPVFSWMDHVKLPGDITLYNLLGGFAVIGVTMVSVKNLSGAIEVAFLQRLPVTGGVRYAVITLCQYAVIAIGLTVAIRVVGFDLSKLGWLFAALGVGLGFGLQEIVANFICGIILLFERPIRVNDIVTVGEITGVVTRIHIRATTITDWDRKEFVVPNKQLITGTLLNWTLSSPVNRLIIPVGVAYGTDLRKAGKVLLEIAATHPNVLSEPAPQFAVEAFDASSLRLTLRCFLPDMDNRIATIHDLHAAIHSRFLEDDIVIAFPQMDVRMVAGSS